MDVTLYVWRLRPDNPGHASLQIGGSYVSFWPSSAAGKNDAKLGTTHAPSFPSSYATDRRIERSEANDRLTLTTLAAQAMIDSWKTFKEHPRRYNLIEHNCSTVIAALLETGSGRRPSFMPGVAIEDHAGHWATRLFLRVRFMSRWIQMWTPDDVLRYALEIEPGAARS